MVCRTGYTGEVGVELICPSEDAGALWDAVVARGATPCGLGARDTLRLEVCYPLHGSDITRRHRCDLGRPRLGLRARQGLHRRRRAPPRQGRRAAAATRRLRDGGEGDPARRACRSRAAASSRRAPTRRCSTGASGWATFPPRGATPDTPIVVDVRGKPRAGARRRESRSTRQGGVTRGSCRVLPRRPQVPPRARLGPHRGRRGRARHHLVRPGRARRPRPLRAAGRRRDDRPRRSPTARSSPSRRSRT